uniref:Regulator of Vps4 activity in the MVB pathway protein n=1 Tax=Davidia involucrata TaxID=16924 RepID=A0A5B7AJL5_DAVIN
MLDGLLGRGFSSKCKSLIKLTRTRIDVIQRNKDARQRIMKKDIADLLANGLDINAYGRAEDFFAGLSLLFCYDFIEQSCEYILKQLSIMQKQRECPEECREAVSSLMFAAARFSDLPELRELRDMFQERYGSSLECFANQKFVEKLSSKPPTTEKKLQLLQDIALEFSIKWNSRGFEQRMATPSAVTQDQPGKYGPYYVTDDKYKLPNGKDTVPKREKSSVSSKKRGELVNDRHGMRNGMEGDGHEPLASRKETIPQRDNHDISFRGRQEFTADKHELLNGKESTLKTVGSGSSSRGKKPELIDGGYKLHNDRIDIVPGRDVWNPLSYGKPEAAASCAGLPVKSEGKDVSSAGYNHGGQQNIVSSTRKVQEEETDKLKSYYSNALPPPYVISKDNAIPPPYTKPKDSKHEGNIGSKHSSSDCDGASMGPSTHNRANSVNRSERMQIGSEHPNNEGQVVGPARVKSHGHEKDYHCQDDVTLPKPRSVRRKHSKSSSSHDDHGNFEDAGAVKRSSTSRRRENSRRGLQILFDDEHYIKDEEERMIDKLLLHYSKKPSTYERGKVRRKSKPHPSHQIAANAGESMQNRSGDGSDAEPEMVPPPTRSVSLPREQTAPSETKKVYARANTFQPDNQARHVHPKLPDYDDLAARFAALKGR